MDAKLVIGLLADVLYIKGIINITELEAMYDITKAQDIQVVIDKMLRGELSEQRKGESYGGIII